MTLTFKKPRLDLKIGQRVEIVPTMVAKGLEPTGIILSMGWALVDVLCAEIANPTKRHTVELYHGEIASIIEEPTEESFNVVKEELLYNQRKEIDRLQAAVSSLLIENVNLTNLTYKHFVKNDFKL